MKNFVLTLGIALFCFIGKAQTNYSDLYHKDLVFYGFDYSNFRLTDAEFMDREIDRWVFHWIWWKMNWLNDSRMKSLFNASSIQQNYRPTIDRARTLKRVDLIDAYPHHFTEEKAKEILNSYEFTEENGLGFMVIVENYNRKEQQSSSYMVFFDIATKNPLRIDYFVQKDGNSYSRKEDWGDNMLLAMRTYSAQFLGK